MRRKTLIDFLVIILLIVTLVGAEAKTIKLRYASFLPAAHFWFKDICKLWAEEIEKRSNGRVQINMYPGRSLLGAKETYGGVVDGITDIATGVFD